MKRYDVVIINRSFWPIYPVIGEALLRLAEKLAPSKKVGIIMQDHQNISQSLKKSNRGNGVSFFKAFGFSNSSSSIVVRIFDNLYFMFYTFFCLVIIRPKIIYVSTDPPVLVPFIVSIFSKIMNLKYIYHIQDIHPEATNTLIKINCFIFNLIKKIDNFSIKNANCLITLNNIMKDEIISRSKINKEILIIDNPSIPSVNEVLYRKKKGFSFTGNIGRLQRINLLIESIIEYEKKGGNFEFAFAGGGIFSNKILNLSKNSSKVIYHGLVSSEKAGLISSEYEWALLPIEDKITRYAFPSKLSSYILSDAKILAICGKDTSVAEWIKQKNVGIVVDPNVSEIVKIFFKIQNNKINLDFPGIKNKELKKNLSMETFLKKIENELTKLQNE